MPSIWSELNIVLENQNKYRFYGRRKGHALRQSRRDLLRYCLPRLKVSLPASNEQLDPSIMFKPNIKEYWMEIGFGGGEHLAEIAANNPNVGFIGCEPYVNGVASLLNHIRARNLDNVRIFDNDARNLLVRLPNSSITRLYLLYSDPWPKKRHHRRRFIQPDTLRQLSRIIVDNGKFTFSSDDMGYIRWTLFHISAHKTFDWLANTACDWTVRPNESIETRYESKALKQGSNCIYLTFNRVARSKR